MRGGDISNEVPPRTLVVFEGLVADLPDTRTRALHAVDLKRKRWKSAAARWRLSHAVVNTCWRMDCRVELVSFLDQREADAIEQHFESGHWPFADLRVTTPAELAHELVYRPDVLFVFDPDGARWATYGHKGRIIDPARPDDMLHAVRGRVGR